MLATLLRLFCLLIIDGHSLLFLATQSVTESIHDKEESCHDCVRSYNCRDAKSKHAEKQHLCVL